MPRARNIKPSLFKNEDLGTADPLLTILFQGLWCLADRAGRLEDRPLRIKAEIFPYRDLSAQDINRYLTELASLGFIHRYQVENLAIIQVCKFAKHQSPHKTEKPSELPAAPNDYKAQTPITDIAPLNNGSLTDVAALNHERGIMNHERENGAAAPRPQKGSRIPEPFLLTSEMREYARERAPEIDVVIETEKFVNYWRAKSGRDATKVDWTATWRNWILKAKEFVPSTKAPEARPKSGIIW